MTDSPAPAPTTDAAHEQQLLDEVAKISSLTAPWAVRVAATLRVPDLVAAGVTSVPELAERTGTNADALGRLMRYLTAIGVFRATGSSSYQLTELGQFFRDDHPTGLRAFLDQNGFAARLDGVTAHLGTAVRTGRSVYEEVYGRPFWKDQDGYPDEKLSFNNVMASHSRWFGPDLRTSFPWNDFRRVVDVGGGTGAGTFLAELLTAFPDIRATLVEDPQETAITAEKALAPVRDRAEIVRQTLFTDPPAGHDLYVLTNILRNWGDEDASAILAGCARAAGPSGGRVVVIERLLTADPHQVHVTDANLRILMLLGGKERTADDFRELGQGVGLRLSRVLPTDYSHMYLIEYEVARPGQ